MRPGSRILVVSPEAWGPAKLSKHHYARSLHDKGMQVFFLGPYHGTHWELEPTSSGVTLVHAPPLPRGLRWLPGPLRALVESKRMDALASLCGAPFDVLWNFDLYRFRWLKDRRKAALRLLHVMDLPDPDVISVPANLADAVVLISATMAGHLPDGAPKPLTVPHGLADRTSSDHKPPALVDGIRSAYLGNMAIPYLDRSSLLRAVRAHPEMTLYLLGPYGGNLGDRPMDPIWEAILKEPNVIWTGAIPSEHVHAWLSAMDLLIIAYDSARYLNETAHPHKVMEYLASGRPVLATYMRDMAHLDHLIEMLPPGVPIDHALGKVLNDLEQLGTLELFNARRTYALANTYAKHTTTILEHIDHLTDRP